MKHVLFWLAYIVASLTLAGVMIGLLRSIERAMRTLELRSWYKHRKRR